ncbi:polysaccharide deacetylase family protein [Sutcliffiella cohnii]|uniref:polysaccharide deacetylase family protein n=1 Tax=Sutcliffiella cohnii TaxID=33932 RepID=UPI001F336B91|nr:polysaccharide deacetylase family protein [Sutcliffiella cohnii]MED4015293.1 polysaccharide deacetylase family protein [Sutcliffiella cohnii]
MSTSIVAQEVAGIKDSLMLEIEEKASAYEIPPQDARIDKVWKAVPGYNGRTVDIKASYEKMKKSGVFDEKKLVFKQLSPQIHLKDLSASPIYKGHEDKKMVSFIVNVAWGNEYIPDMLETLKKHEIKATFFLEGRWVKENPSIAKMIVDAGHEVGNHSYSHPNMKTLGANAVRDQLLKTNSVIEATTGVKVKWFAPPSGSFRQEVVEIAKQYNMGTIMWSVDTIDWQRPEPNVIVDRVMGKVHPGAIILMHPTDPTSKSLETLIVSIKEKDLHIGTISSLLSEERMD